MLKCECNGCERKGCKSRITFTSLRKACSNAAVVRIVWNGREYSLCDKCKRPDDVVVARLKRA